MAIKRKRRRVKRRRAKSNPKKTHRKKKRAAVKNPRKAHRRKRRSNPSRKRARVRVRRAHRRNPKKRARSHKRRRHVSNPHRGRRRGKRASRRNPLPVWAAVGLSALAGLLTYGVLNAGSFALTQRMDPSLATLQRNRYIAGALGLAGGVILGVAGHPLAGVAVAAGAAASLGGSQLSVGLGNVIEKKPETKAIAGVFMPQGMAGIAQAPRQLGMGALAQMGDWQAAGYGPAYARG